MGVALLLGAIASGLARAGGFALQNQNGAGTGNAFAGASAAAEDASTIYFNPAGMLLLPRGHSISAAVTLLNRTVEFSDRGTANVPTFPLGGDGGDGGSLAIVPAIYWAYSPDSQWAVGIGLSPTFGNVTEFDKDFIGRFSGYFAEIRQINLNPSVAYRVDDRISIGFGLNFARNETEFRQMAVVGAGAQRDAHLKGDDTAIGWNVGVMMQMTPATRFGLAYRSSMEFDLSGRQRIVGLLNTGIGAELETPDNASLALHHQLSPRWELLGDVTWTGWSKIQDIKVEGGTSPVLSYRFKDTWRLGLGVAYKFDDKWKFRAGLAFDEAPVRSAGDRTMTLPDSDRSWISLGARYALSPQSSVDLGYSHVFFDDAPTRRVASIPAVLGGRQVIRGTFDVTADLLSVQLNHSF